MKKMKNFFAVLLLLYAFSGFGQVKDIGITFNKKGYIEEILPQKNMLLIDYLDEDQIVREQLVIDSKSKIQIDGKPGKTDQLKVGMEVNVTGEYFETTQTSQATLIAGNSENKKDVTITTGRLDAIKDDYAFIDGNKIKVASGKKIIGDKKSGYAGKTFNNFTELKLGSLMALDGNYNPEGYVAATKISIAPETETKADKLAKERASKAFYEQYYTTWNDPAKRSSMFGMSFEQEGHIYNNAALQDYINRLAQSLIPEHIKNKLHFMFMVTDNMQWNANVRANGVSVVYLGLILDMQNEAQLAAVLGHEISHAIYEHTALMSTEREIAADNADKRNNTSAQVKNVINKFKPNVFIKDAKGNTILQKDIKTGTADILLRDLPNAKGAKALSDYSIHDELQADRVGLFLMVQAGYDPREAAFVWKREYNRSSPVTEKKKRNADDPNNPLKKDGDIVDLGAGYLNNALAKKANKFNAQSGRTHPEELMRFQKLDELIYEYYSEPALLASLKKNEESYLKLIKPIAKDIEERQIAQEQEIKEEKKKKPILEKQFKENRNKTKAKLATITKPILIYKGYPLSPVVNIQELCGKKKCSSPDIEDELAYASDYYENISTIFMEKVDAFKDAEPHHKDEDFAHIYLLSKMLNERSIDFATAVALCYREKVIDTNISPEVMRAIIEEAYTGDEYLEIVQYLNKKN